MRPATRWAGLALSQVDNSIGHGPRSAVCGQRISSCPWAISVGLSFCRVLSCSGRKPQAASRKPFSSDTDNAAEFALQL
jgi:hypothetical protein